MQLGRERESSKMEGERREGVGGLLSPFMKTDRTEFLSTNLKESLNKKQYCFNEWQRTPYAVLFQ